MIARIWRLPAAVRVAVLFAGVVAVGAAVLSWDAGRWGAGEIGIDPGLTWLWPIVVDGMIAGGTVAVLVVRERGWRAYVWALLLAGLGVSIFVNGAHAPAGGPGVGALTLHRAGSAVPALALAAMLHLLVIIARSTRAAPTRQSAPAPARTKRASERPKVLLEDGRRVSPGHARKLRAARRRAEVAA